MMTKYNSAEYTIDIPNKGKEIFKELRGLSTDKERTDFLNKMTKKSLIEYLKDNNRYESGQEKCRKDKLIKIIINQFNNMIFWENLLVYVKSEMIFQEQMNIKKKERI